MCSKNGCFKLIFQNGDLVAYRTSDMSLIWNTHLYTNGQMVKACAETDGFKFYAIAYGSTLFTQIAISLPSPYDVKFTDNGQLLFVMRNSGEIYEYSNFGVGTNCKSNTNCSESIVDVGECISTGQAKISCNGCFKMVLEKGNLVVYYNNAPGLPPIYTFNTNGQAVKACASSSAPFYFYSASGQIVWGSFIHMYSLGVYMKLLDNGQIVFASKNESDILISTYGKSTSCYNAFNDTKCIGNVLSNTECLYPNQAL